MSPFSIEEAHLLPSNQELVCFFLFWELPPPHPKTEPETSRMSGKCSIPELQPQPWTLCLKRSSSSLHRLDRVLILQKSSSSGELLLKNSRTHYKGRQGIEKPSEYERRIAVCQGVKGVKEGCPGSGRERSKGVCPAGGSWQLHLQTRRQVLYCKCPSPQEF